MHVSFRDPPSLRPGNKLRAAPACVFAAAIALACPLANSATFDEQKASVSQAVESQEEAAIIQLLEAGIAENKPAQATAIASDWLKDNLPETPRLLFLLGRNAELSGDWREAAAFYQQYLKQAGPDAKDAAEAITATYTLLINELDDSEGAYIFGRSQAANLASNHRFRQYDRWFLDLARSNEDLPATTERLLTTASSGVDADYIIAFHSDDLLWLINEIHSTRLDQMSRRFDENFVRNTKALAKKLDFNPELQLLLDWKVSVKAYIMDRIDGRETEAPIAAAKALLEKYPSYAKEVQTDWAGGSTSRYYRDDPKKYWPHQIENKFPLIRKAAEQLNELQFAQLLRTWSYRYYDSGPEVFSAEEYLTLIAENPQWINRRTGPILDLKWSNAVTVEEAKKIAPTLKYNPSPEASLIRTVAAVGEDKDYDKLMDHLLNEEAWRLDQNELNSRYADTLWHWAGRPGGNAKHDQQIKRTRKIADSIPDSKTLAKIDPKQRLIKFQELWKEYKSPTPRTPGLLNQIRSLLMVTPEAMTQLLNDSSIEARLLAKDMLNSSLKDGEKELINQNGISTLGTENFNPLIDQIASRNHGLERLKQNEKLYQPYPLLGAIEKALRQQLKGETLDPWLVTAWLNARFPENEEQDSKLMQALLNSSGWKSLPFETRHAARKAYPEIVLNEAQKELREQTDPKTVCTELLALTETSSAKDAAAALQKTTTALLAAPRRISPPNLDLLAELDDAVWADPEFTAAVINFVDQTRLTTPYREFGDRIVDLANKSRDSSTILPLTPYIWTTIQTYHRPFPTIMELASSLATEQPEAANALARAGLHTIARHNRGHTWFKRDSDIPALKTIRGKTAMQLGLIEIPVAPNHPSYPAYLSQAEWMTDNIDSAWKLLDANWETFIAIHRELTVPYTMWALQRNIETRNSDRQQELIQQLLDWTNESTSTLRPAEKAAIEIAYGDIAMQRGQIRQALEIFKRVQDRELYQDIPARHVATLRRVRGMRVAKDFDGALQVLAELEFERIPGIWIDVRFARAEVHYDMEEFNDAQDDIDSILNREPNHPDARILLGKIQLKRQKLMEATEVELGSNTEEPSLVPGEKLKVTLTDPTLAVSGAGTEIEVAVWTTTGDREQFFLRQFGDQKTKFRGEVPTALGAPVLDDGTLQVIGNDEVYYAYSERFLEKMNQTENKRGGPIRVASDGLLMASSRKLLNEAEQRRADMQAVMDEIKDENRTNTEAAARAQLARQAVDPDAKQSNPLERYLSNVAKPGNPVHIRVIDPDRSRTAEIDELVVSASTSSGDSISRVTLRETDTHSGWFEGSVTTTSASARAFADDSEPGRNPNMVISANPDYPAWRPILSEGDLPEFSIDLNDNLPLGQMTIRAVEPESSLKKFIVQTGMNRSDWTTVAVYPENPVAIEKPWHPSVLVMNDSDNYHNINKRSVYDIAELREHVEKGWITQRYGAGTADNVAGPSEAMTEEIPGKVKWLRQNRHHNSHIIYRFRAYFYEPKEVVRRFKVDLGNYQVPKGTHPSVADPPQFLLAVNGRPITDKERPEQLEGEVRLQPGVHQFEIWGTGWDCTIGFGRSIELSANLGPEDALVNCPDTFFDPASFPKDSFDPRNSPATIQSNESGKAFKVDFAEDSRARLIRLIFLEQEGQLPTINKITLTDADGQTVLPIEEDYATLNKNDTLEILTGDRITVRYQDDRFVTEEKQRQERFLDVSFTDARIEFADTEPRFSSRHNELRPYYEKLLRFKHGETISLVIRDADMDTSEAPDTIPVILTSESGGSTTFTATETDDSTGVFILPVTPVAGKASGDKQFQVAEGATLSAGYFDEENNRPGVLTERTTSIEHAAFTEPRFIVGHTEVTPWEPEPGTDPMATLIHGFDPQYTKSPDGRINKMAERIRQRWLIENKMLPTDRAPEGGFQAVHGQPLYVELLAPQYALGVASTVTIYAQTESGRKLAATNSESAFDISAPGTIQLTGKLNLSPGDMRNWFNSPTLASYRNQSPWSSTDTFNTDRFRIFIPVVAGVLPNYGVLSKEEMEAIAERNVDTRGSAIELFARSRSLVARTGERIHVGFKFTKPDGTNHWLTTSAHVRSYPAFDIMNEEYHSPMKSAYAGESLYMRVVDLGANTTDGIDQVRVLMQSKSGSKYYATLSESGPNTGIFRDDIFLSYSTEEEANTESIDVNRVGFPITYGDTIAARYTDANGTATDTQFVSISKGADGSIAPFSKVYEDEEIAMRTQFSLAEAYLEMAKRHRKLGQTEQADREYASAKLLLSKAMDQFTEPDTRAHAEYLLGMLTMEEALATEEDELREIRFRAALSRFMNVTGSYPLSLHASRAQYRIASIYEELNEPEIAAQEYVKLAYKYPESEFLATSMAKLGTHFLKKASRYEQEAKPLLARAEEDKDAAFEGKALQKIAESEYLKTASIFGRLQERFPTNKLAGPAGLRAGQAYMRANHFRDAISMFNKVIAEQSYDGPDVRAQAMYWVGMCHQETRMQMAAYSAFKRLTYDFPESKWAAYARAQLSQERLLKLESQLELERLEAGQ